MSTLQPRRIVHRGHVEASGYLFDTALIGMEETRRRILQLWAPGVQVYSHDRSYYVRLQAPVRVDCALSIGTPLVMTENILSALPLAQDELSALGAPSDSVVYVSGGSACVAPLNSFVVVSPASWLDISQFKTVLVSTLGSVYEAPKVVAEPEPFDARAKLDGAPAATPELLETIAALKTGPSKEERVGGGSPFGGNAGGMLTDLLGSVVGSVSTLAGMFSRKQTQSGSYQGTGYGETELGSLFENMSSALRRLTMRLLQKTQLSRILGRRQAMYMARMMAMFENGNLDDALRHAVPIDDLPPTLGQSAAFGVPTPRTNLAIVPQRPRNSHLIGAEVDVLGYLRQLYRAAFDRLVAQGRFEEAAFVLAELLRSNEEAVAFLERHGKFRLAAELAEARELSPGLVVRQWFLAGEVKRAIGIARRTQAFADAVLRLERTNRKQAEELRLVWAESLADAGNYAGAVDVIWPLTLERSRAITWMDRTIEVGGPVAARMLARKLSLVPEEFEDIRQRCLIFLDDESFEQRTARLSFVEALCKGQRNTQAQTLARAATRAILRDAGQDYHALKPKQFRSLVEFTGDGALRTDVPPFPTAEQSSRSSEPLRLEFASADCGSLPIPDAAILADGRMLLALGEVGVKLLTRDGRTITHFDHPAHRLVLSDHGDRAIALARRGEVWRLTRLDLLERRATDWCEAHLDAFAPSYDGSLWFIGAKGDFYVIDASAEKFEALWRVPDAGERVVDVARTATSCSFLTSGESRLEKWVYRLPLLTLRGRTLSPALPENVSCLVLRAALSADGVYLDQSLYGYWEPEKSTSPLKGSQEMAELTPLPVLQLRVFGDYEDVVKHEFPIGDAKSQPGQPEILRTRVVSPVYEDAGARVRVIDLQEPRITAEVFLANAKQISSRLTDSDVTITDDCGRVLVIDLSRNCLTRNLRV